MGKDHYGSTPSISAALAGVLCSSAAGAVSAYFFSGIIDTESRMELSGECGLDLKMLFSAVALSVLVLLAVQISFLCAVSGSLFPSFVYGVVSYEGLVLRFLG